MKGAELEESKKIAVGTSRGFQGTAGCWAEITRPEQVPFRFAPASRPGTTLL